MTSPPTPPPEPPEPLTPAEARLQDVLVVLRDETPTPPEHLTAAVLRSARFERGVRSATRTAAQLGAAALEGIALLLGLKRPRA